jgi:hypothetical protein
MYSHTNVLRGKVDMFPQQELIDMLLSLWYETKKQLEKSQT